MRCLCWSLLPTAMLSQTTVRVELYMYIVHIRFLYGKTKDSKITNHKTSNQLEALKMISLQYVINAKLSTKLKRNLLAKKKRDGRERVACCVYHIFRHPIVNFARIANANCVCPFFVICRFFRYRILYRFDLFCHCIVNSTFIAIYFYYYVFFAHTGE